jgi:tetrapyrrole methylase family protein/MazG family protein
VLDALVSEARVRWGLDPAAGIQVVASERLVATPIEPSRPLLVVPLALLGVRSTDPGVRSTDLGFRSTDPSVRSTEPGVRSSDAADLDSPDPVGPTDALPGRHGPRGRTALDVLARLYPADHPVGRLGRPEVSSIAALTPGDLAGPLYVGPVAVDLSPTGPWALPWISERLRRPDGCPWDREQTHESLRKHLLEESFEVYDALGQGATPELAEELGDLFLQIVLHAQLAAEEGVFDLADVGATLGRKIVRRHPHVFGDAVARTASDVNRQWERIKETERAEAAAANAPARASADALDAAQAAADEAGTAEPPKSALDGISRAMPALAASQEMQERASSLGYDWPTIDGIVEKVREELDELLAAETPAEIREELGDLMMVTVNLARRHGIEAEAALRAANDKFRRRFRSVERQAAERGVALRDMTFEQLDALWDTAKVEERAEDSTR